MRSPYTAILASRSGFAARPGVWINARGRRSSSLSRRRCRAGGACRGRDCVGSPYQRESRHVGASPAIHRLVANLAIGIAALPKGETGHDQPILRAAMRTFVDRHWYVPVRRTSWPQRHESPMRSRFAASQNRPGGRGRASAPPPIPGRAPGPLPGKAFFFGAAMRPSR